MQTERHQGQRIIIDREVEILFIASRVLPGRRAELRAVLTGKLRQEHPVKIDQTELTGGVDQNIVGFDISVGERLLQQP